MTIDQRRAAIIAAGYTIAHNDLGSLGLSWYALLPGETVFFDNLEACEANPEINHVQNYLGFFCSEKDLIDEVYELVQSEQAVQNYVAPLRPR